MIKKKPYYSACPLPKECSSSYTPEPRPLNRRVLQDYFSEEGRRFSRSFSEKRRKEIKHNLRSVPTQLAAMMLEKMANILLKED